MCHLEYKQSYKITVKVCGSGVQDRAVVKDSQLTAVSFWEYNNYAQYKPSNGRLFNTGRYGGSWLAGRHAWDLNSLFENNIKNCYF